MIQLQLVMTLITSKPTNLHFNHNLAQKTLSSITTQKQTQTDPGSRSRRGGKNRNQYNLVSAKNNN